MSDEVVAPDPAVIEQNTSGVVGVLAEALAQHVCSYHGPPNGTATSYCWCGWSGWDYAAHVASVVAALPNIAIVSHADIREMIGPSRAVDDCPQCNETVQWEKNAYDLRDNDDHRYSWRAYCETCNLDLELMPWPNPPVAARAAGGQA